MAGDWIKIESNTPDKPEVMKIARLCGLSRDETFGKLFRFWAWLDANSVDGTVDGVASTDVDALVDAQAFSSALEVVGWCAFDDEAELLTVPNYERHNGAPAKTRGLSSLRQRRYRNGPGVTPPLPNSNAGSDSAVTIPLPEKRRVESKEKGKKKTTISGTFKRPTGPEVAAYCQERATAGHPPVNASGFCDYYDAQGWKVGRNAMKDWKAAVRTWERREADDGAARPLVVG